MVALRAHFCFSRTDNRATPAQCGCIEFGESNFLIQAGSCREFREQLLGDFKVGVDILNVVAVVERVTKPDYLRGDRLVVYRHGSFKNIG